MTIPEISGGLGWGFPIFKPQRQEAADSLVGHGYSPKSIGRGHRAFLVGNDDELTDVEKFP